jgi:hypothetical protein
MKGTQQLAHNLPSQFAHLLFGLMIHAASGLGRLDDNAGLESDDEVRVMTA